MAKPSITLKYLLWTWGFFLLVLSLVFVFATRRAERSVMAEAEDRARVSLDLARHLLARDAPFAGPAALAAWADDLGPHLGFRLTYIVDGRVVADSEVRSPGLQGMEDHADRPEVRLARETGHGQDVRQSHTLGRDMLYVAERFAGAPGAPAGILRLALPVSSLRNEVARFRDTLLAVMALVFAAGGVAAWGLARRMTGTIREISGAVAAIGQGHFDRRIHIVWARDFAPLAGAINALAERIGAHVREIEVRRERQEAILDGMAEGLAILDGAGRIVAANRALRELFPRLPDLVGRTPLEAGMPLCVERALAEFQASGEKTMRIGRFELATGRVVEVTAAATSGGAGGPGRVVTFHDVTEAATMDRIFRDFVIDASHNLRTPLTKIQGFAESARDALAPASPGEGAPAVAAQALDKVVRAAGDMAGVINDLLAAARDRFDRAVAAAPAVDALAALRQALAACGVMLRSRGVAARITAAPDGPLPVRAGHEALVRIFSALLCQTPEAATLDITAGLAGESVEIRFRGPAALGPEPWAAELAASGGEAFLDGATRVVRLPRAAG